MSKHLLQLLFKRSWKESDELPQNHDHAISVYPFCDCSQWALSPTSLLTSFQSMWYCVDSVVECTMSLYLIWVCHQATHVINEHEPLFILKVSSMNTCHYSLWRFYLKSFHVCTIAMLQLVRKTLFRIFLQKSILTFWLAERVGQPESLSFSTEPPLWCGPVPFAVCGQPSLPWQAKPLTWCWGHQSWYRSRQTLRPPLGSSCPWGGAGRPLAQTSFGQAPPFLASQQNHKCSWKNVSSESSKNKYLNMF